MSRVDKRRHKKEYEHEIRVDNYIYNVNSLFLTDNSKTVTEAVSAIIKDKMIRTFERATK